MPEHELLLRINDTLMKICEDIGELKSDQKVTAKEVKGLRADVDDLKKERNMAVGGSKVIVEVSGIVSTGVSLAVAGFAYFRGQ